MLFDVAKKDIELVRGDTLAFGLEFVRDDEEEFIDLDSAYFTIRAQFDESILCQASLGDGIAKESDGVYSIRVSPEQTATLSPGAYYYDMRVGVGNDEYTIFIGILNVIPSATGGETGV